MRRTVITVGVLTLAVSSVFGCTKTLQGDPAKDTRGADAAELNPGNYPTTPRPPLGAAGADGKYVEARRMADFLTMPFQVDPALDGRGMDTGVVTSTSLGSRLRIKTPASIADTFVAGFGVEAGEGTKKWLQNMVLRFTTPETATAAAMDLAKSTKTDLLDSDKTIPTTPIGIPRYAETGAFTWSDYGGANVLAFTAHGPYVLVQMINEPNSATELVAATLDKQIPLIDSFKPTPVDKLADLPLDPDGLLTRTLEPSEEDRTLLRLGVYGPHGFLAYSDSPADDQKIFDEAGVTAVSIAGSDVFVARDADGAQRIVDGFAKQIVQRADPVDGAPGLPGSQCYRTETSPGKEFSITIYECIATVGRYAFQTVSQQKTAVYQKTAAQYLLLTAN